MPETSCLEVPPSVLSVQKLLVLLSGNWVFTLGIQWGCWPGKYRKGTVQFLDTDLERVYRSMAFLLHHVTLFIFWCLSCSCDITLASISAGWEQSFSKDSVAHVQKYLTKNEVPNNLFEVRVLCYHFHQFSVEWSAYEEDAVFVHLRSIDPSPFDCFPLFIGSRTSRRSSLISEETSSGSLLRATSTLVSVSGRIWN